VPRELTLLLILPAFPVLLGATTVLLVSTALLVSRATSYPTETV